MLLKLGNKQEFDKFVRVLVLSNITITHYCSQAHVLYSKGRKNCGLFPQGYRFMILLATMQANFLSFCVVLFKRLYFDTVVSDESFISILKVPELC